MDKNIVITFGSHKHYIEAGSRLMHQCWHSKLFGRHLLYTPVHLQGPFWKQHSPFILSNPRGYGYWIWKPYLIQKTMNSMKDGDVLLYLDCGCELDVNKHSKIQSALKLVERELLMGTICSPQHDDESWTKYDVIECIKAPIDTLKTPQRQAGALIFLVCPKTRRLVNEWYELCCDYHNIDDSPSVLANAPNFVEHRHDQSVFSLLTKKHNLFSRHILDCIDYIRNRTGETKLPNIPKPRMSMNIKR